jgi:DNA mismatch repair ATPase MutS
MQIEVSNGEIVDKFTILVIKNERINDDNKLRNIIKELKSLEHTLNKIQYNHEDLLDLFSINEQLWDIEDELRLCEEQERFDDYFITAARQVYKLNDERAAIKKKINIDTNSELTEEKSYN